MSQGGCDGAEVVVQVVAGGSSSTCACYLVAAYGGGASGNKVIYGTSQLRSVGEKEGVLEPEGAAKIGGDRKERQERGGRRRRQRRIGNPKECGEL